MNEFFFIPQLDDSTRSGPHLKKLLLIKIKRKKIHYPPTLVHGACGNSGTNVAYTVRVTCIVSR
jgi:hypothetical protein